MGGSKNKKILSLQTEKAIRTSSSFDVLNKKKTCNPIKCHVEYTPMMVTSLLAL